jgi:hypothetical protein
MHKDSTASPRYSVPRPRPDLRHLWRFNDYRIQADVAVLTLRDGSGQPSGEVLIDRDDLDRVLEAAHWGKAEPKPGLVYARGTMRGLAAPRGHRKPALFLHRFILDAPPGSEVDHWNGNGLDCRRENLRITDQKGNQHNQRGHRRVRELESAMRDLLRCPHQGQQCACKRRALALLKVAA